MADFYIVQGDTSPAIIGTPKDENDDPISLATAASVKFRMWKPGEAAAKVDATGSIELGTPDKVKYQWVTGDTDQKGDFDGEFEVTWNDGTITTIPNHRKLHIKVRGQLG